MTARLIDGKALAARVRARIAEKVAALNASHGIVPGLAVIYAGDDPASAIYVRSKSAAAHEVGFRAFDLRLPATISEHALISEVRQLNGDSSVNGILIQLPLPGGISAERVIAAVDPLKDVDGLTAHNAGKLATGEFGPKHGLIPCTPSGSLMLIKEELGDIAGREALVIGRSNLVGKPMAQLLLQENCTVTIAHSKTRDIAALARRADILIAATGKAEMVRGDWIKPGAVVIDVGVNRRDAGGGRTKLVGDVAIDEALPVAGAITPVSGGVGPMTIACLMRNTLIAASLQAGLPHPEI